ncbi:MAG TPA: hypothetical protein VMU39_05390 [Solirubrobacteraceae bacterium]|nr:hypothetical protein [Solirubrobacteraceae bacterium]
MPERAVAGAVPERAVAGADRPDARRTCPGLWIILIPELGGSGSASAVVVIGLANVKVEPRAFKEVSADG